MTTRPLNRVLQHLRRTALVQEGAARTDGQLLTCFIDNRDEAAFEALVRRHGPMVLGVCRRLFGNHHDAEDAFQATFLVLVRKAASVVPREMLANWLYGVARTVALRARVAAVKRWSRERQMTDIPEPEAVERDPWADLVPVLDQELSGLPEKYRVPILLCDLEGKSHKEAARQLGWPIGTLSGRLSRGRVLLARRLARHGLALSGGVLAALLSQHALAQVPAWVTTSTTRAAGWLAAGQAARAAGISAQVVALTEGVVKAMFMAKLKIVTGVLLVLGVAGAGTRACLHSAQAKERQGKIAAVPSDPMQPARTRNASSSDVPLVEPVQPTPGRPEGRPTAAAVAAHGLGQEWLKSFLGLAARFKYRIPVETGSTQFEDGARLEILDVWGTQPEIKIGGQYVVHGKYLLPTHDKGTLYFHESATDARNASGPELDLQFMPVTKGQGEFTLMHTMGCPGYFHLTLMVEKGGTVADMYFGTGDNVWRKKR